MLQQLTIARRVAAVSALSLLAAVPAQAHFIWVLVGSEAAPPQLVLAENPAEEMTDDLVPKIAAKAWDASGKELAFTQGKKSWNGPVDFSKAIAAKQSWGLMDHGGKPFFIEYYAKGGAGIAETANEMKLPFELYARQDGAEIVATLKLNGQPAADSKVNVHLPTGGSLELQTDAKGEIRFAAAGGGHYGLRARAIEAKKGESDGKAYDEVRSYTTLAFALPGAAAPKVEAPKKAEGEHGQHGGEAKHGGGHGEQAKHGG